MAIPIEWVVVGEGHDLGKERSLFLFEHIDRVPHHGGVWHTPAQFLVFVINFFEVILVVKLVKAMFEEEIFSAEKRLVLPWNQWVL